MFAWSVQIIIGLESVSSRCLHYFPAAMSVFHGLVHQHGSFILVLGSLNLCKIFRQIFEDWENVQTSKNWKGVNHLSPVTLWFLEFLHWMVFQFSIAWRCNPRIHGIAAGDLTVDLANKDCKASFDMLLPCLEKQQGSRVPNETLCSLFSQLAVKIRQHYLKLNNFWPNLY